jgi:hypothetical protein
MDPFSALIFHGGVMARFVRLLISFEHRVLAYVLPGE